MSLIVVGHSASTCIISNTQSKGYHYIHSRCPFPTLTEKIFVTYIEICLIHMACNVLFNMVWVCEL